MQITKPKDVNARTIYIHSHAHKIPLLIDGQRTSNGYVRCSFALDRAKALCSMIARGRKPKK